MKMLLLILTLVSFSPTSFAGKEQIPPTKVVDPVRYDSSEWDELSRVQLTGVEKERADQTALTYLYQILGAQSPSERMNFDVNQAARQRGQALKGHSVWQYDLPMDKGFPPELRRQVISRACENDTDVAKQYPVASFEVKSGCHFGVVAGAQPHFGSACSKLESLDTIETFAMLRIRCRTNHSEQPGVARRIEILGAPIR